MRNLPTYEQFNENYLPYFGVKQALDDAKENDPKEEGEKEMKKPEVPSFRRVYAMSPTWWNTWKSEKSEEYNIVHDAFSKTYIVTSKKDKNPVFVYDYGRHKIFTNESPEIFAIDNIVTPMELEKAKEKDVADPKGVLKAKEEGDKKQAIEPASPAPEEETEKTEEE